jgi:hypothetical protein
MYKSTRLIEFIGWLVLKVPPTIQPMAILAMGKQLALASVLWVTFLYTQSWISWIAVALAIPPTVWIFGFVIHRYGTAWRRYYFGLMDYHAAIVAAHLVATRLTDGRLAFDPLKPFAAVIKKSAPGMADSEVEKHLSQWKQEFDNFEFRQLFWELYAETVGNSDADEMVNEIRESMARNENYNESLLRYIIGKVIQKNAGPEQNRRYWRAVLRGKVT